MAAVHSISLYECELLEFYAARAQGRATTEWPHLAITTNAYYV